MQRFHKISEVVFTAKALKFERITKPLFAGWYNKGLAFDKKPS